MTAKVTRLSAPDDETLFVPGNDPAEILATAQAEIEDHEEVITALDDIKVSWWRVNPCRPGNCYDGGGHNGHWTPTSGRTRGGFQGATVEVGYREDQP